ncbi:MAG: RecX family transcriptional regulator [Saprospiraceae bacterium]|nr:RecX family transcriptional regulator [Saprospiraceae bacterium]
MNLDIVLSKMRRYCAYRERSHKEVRYKLVEMKVYGMDLERIMTQLIEEDFLNELRYARAYVSGKFRMNKWGRNKILLGLKQQSISPYCIKKAMEEIDAVEYNAVLYQLLEKKIRQYSKDDVYSKRNKLIKYALGRGYNMNEMMSHIEALINKDQTISR